ncbi:hypothetical protein EVAR_32622_1 [Eumeta japonica]|uniref:Uncharacterized protein n=1 Tax=Eumeta variegata TaxID=151549 RepID=A0A4C1WJN9_EUMVA|nr:hypothetical protein EVAR_32622_1 [Eumeta japonica]
MVKNRGHPIDKKLAKCESDSHRTEGSVQASSLICPRFDRRQTSAAAFQPLISSPVGTHRRMSAPEAQATAAVPVAAWQYTQLSVTHKMHDQRKKSHKSWSTDVSQQSLPEQVVDSSEKNVRAVVHSQK